MPRQGNLYDQFGRDYAAQRSLFDLAGPRVSSLTCCTCGEPLEETPSGYVTCPAGHGRLRAESVSEPNGSWFDE